MTSDQRETEKGKISRRGFVKAAAIAGAGAAAAVGVGAGALNVVRPMRMEKESLLAPISRPIASFRPMKRNIGAVVPSGGEVVRGDYPSTASLTVETGAQSLFKLLQYYGVDYIFAAPGSDWRGLWDAISWSISNGEQSPKYIQLIHEAQATAMALGYSLYTGNAQVVPFHVNLGQIHAGMELHGAYRSAVPMVIMDTTPATFDGENSALPQGDYYYNMQEFHDLGNLTLPFVKWNYDVHTDVNLPQIVARAFQMANEEQQGVVHLYLPEDYLEQTVTQVNIPDFTAFSAPLNPAASPDDLAEVAKLLSNATNPLIIAGGSNDPPMDPDAVPLLVQLAETLGIPVVTANAEVDFPTTNPLHMGFSSSGFSSSGAMSPSYLASADVVLVVNNTTPWFPMNAGPPESTKVINLGPDPIHDRWPYWDYPAQQGLNIKTDVVGGLTSLMAAIDKSMSTSMYSQTQNRIAEWAAAHKAQRASWLSTVQSYSNKTPINNNWLSYNIGQAITDDTIVVTELIIESGGVNQYIERSTPWTKFQNYMVGGLGSGLGVANGIKLAAMDKTVVLLIGDGAFNFNPVQAGLWASKTYDLPMLIVIYNNGSYESMGTAQLHGGWPDNWGKKTDILPGAYLPPYEYSKLADAFGFYGAKITDPSTIQSEITTALNQVKSGKTAIIDAVTAADFLPPNFTGATYKNFPP